MVKMPRKKFVDRKKGGENMSTLAPQEETDFLTVGVSLEEAGEKWRAGDALKSTRFFLRAIEMYNNGLKKFPQSFDLAYNSARLQYDLTQQPRLLFHLGRPLLELLEEALESHKFALNLKQDNADVLFNTAQVLTSLAEVICEARNVTKERQDQALGYFQQASELFNRCLSLQEQELSSASEHDNSNTDAMTYSRYEDAELARELKQNTLDDRWALLIEPVTYDTLSDTIIAQLETLTAICSLRGSYNRHEIQKIEEYYLKNLKDKVKAYGQTSGRGQEMWLAKARFTCALTDAAFHLGLLDVNSYERELSSSFCSPDLAEDPRALCDKADAEIALSFSIGVKLSGFPTSQDLLRLSGLRWRFLSLALDDLTAASKFANVHNPARIHLRRGDCEFLRYQLGHAPTFYDRAIRSASVLIKNAGTYYRGAAGFSRREGATDDENEAIAKEAMATALSGDLDKVRGILRGSQETRSALLEIVEDMKEEGLLSDNDAASIMNVDEGNYETMSN